MRPGDLCDYSCTVDCGHCKGAGPRCQWVDCNVRTRYDVVPCFEAAVSVLHVLTGMTPATQRLCEDHLDEARTILFGSEVELTITPLGGSA